MRVSPVSVRDSPAMWCLRSSVTRPCDIGMTGMVCRADASSNLSPALSGCIAGVRNARTLEFVRWRDNRERLTVDRSRRRVADDQQDGFGARRRQGGDQVRGPALTPGAATKSHLSSAFHVLALPCFHRREDLLLRPTHVRLLEVSSGKQANFPAERMRPEIAPDGGLAAPARSWDAEQFAGALRRPVTRKSLKPLHVGWTTPLAGGRESVEEDSLATHARVAVVVYVCESSTSCSRWTGAMARSTSRSTKNRRSSPSLRPSSRCCRRLSASRTIVDRVARL
jgi:hypothetical protein